MKQKNPYKRFLELPPAALLSFFLFFCGPNLAMADTQTLSNTENNGPGNLQEDEDDKIPQELISLGFTRDDLISRARNGEFQFYTFIDSKSETIGATVTIITENGKAQEWFKGSVYNR